MNRLFAFILFIVGLVSWLFCWLMLMRSPGRKIRSRAEGNVMELDIFSQMLIVFAVIVLEQVIVWFAEDFWEFLKQVRQARSRTAGGGGGS